MHTTKARLVGWPGVDLPLGADRGAVPTLAAIMIMMMMMIIIILLLIMIIL